MTRYRRAGLVAYRVVPIAGLAVCLLLAATANSGVWVTPSLEAISDQQAYPEGSTAALSGSAGGVTPAAKDSSREGCFLTNISALDSRFQGSTELRRLEELFELRGVRFTRWVTSISADDYSGAASRTSIKERHSKCGPFIVASDRSWLLSGQASSTADLTTLNTWAKIYSAEGILPKMPPGEERDKSSGFDLLLTEP